MKHLAPILFLAGLSVVSAVAHDKSLHKGKPTEGTITTVSGDQIDLKTTAGNVKVALTSKTKIEHGKETVDRTHLKAGERISVFGTKLPSGELVAREVLIGTPTSGGHAGHGTSSKEHAQHEKTTTPSKTRK